MLLPDPSLPQRNDMVFQKYGVVRQYYGHPYVPPRGG